MVCVPQARRWLSAHGMQRRMRGLVPSWVRPCSSKFAQRQRHYQRSMLADIFIDTSPWNAHSTASDALWSALPIVHQTGETFASRVAASLVRSMLPRRVTQSSLDPGGPRLSVASLREVEDASLGLLMA